MSHPPFDFHVLSYHLSSKHNLNRRTIYDKRINISKLLLSMTFSILQIVCCTSYFIGSLSHFTSIFIVGAASNAINLLGVSLISLAHFLHGLQADTFLESFTLQKTVGIYQNSIKRVWVASLGSGILTRLRLSFSWLDANWEELEKHMYAGISRIFLRDICYLLDGIVVTIAILVSWFHAFDLIKALMSLRTNSNMDRPATTARVVVVAKKAGAVLDIETDRVPIANSTIRNSPAALDDCPIGLIVDSAPEDEGSTVEAFSPSRHLSSISPTINSFAGNSNIAVSSRSMAVLKKRRKSFIGRSQALPFPLVVSSWGRTVMTGYLKKRSSFHLKRSFYHRWQRRWFIASSGDSGSWLRYFSHSHRVCDEDLRASIDLYKVRLIAPDMSATFTLLLEDGKIELQADSPSHAIEWCGHISRLQRSLCD